MLGMTETGSVCLMSPDESDQPERYRGSFGKPVPELEARVVEPRHARRLRARASRASCGSGGRCSWRGTTGASATRCSPPTAGSAPVTLFTVDDEGFFYFHGRRGDMIKTGGANVSPREVEAVIRDVTGGQLAIVFGVDDAERGQIVAAVIVAAADARSTSTACRRCSRPSSRRTRCRARVRAARAGRVPDALERQARHARGSAR